MEAEKKPRNKKNEEISQAFFNARVNCVMIGEPSRYNKACGGTRDNYPN